QPPLAWADRAPDDFARVLVHCDQTWGARRWDARMAFILAVGGRDHQQTTHSKHFVVWASLGKHPKAGAISNSQTMSAAALSWKTSSRYGPSFSPSRKPCVS